MEIKEIIDEKRDANSIISDLKRKNNIPPAWTKLQEQYEPTKHTVMTDRTYKDKVTRKGIERMTRITLGWQKLAVKRMTELMFATLASNTQISA